MNEATIVRIMGGVAVINHQINSELDFADMIVNGISPKIIRNIQSYINVNDTEMARLMGISVKTFRGRKVFKGNEGDHAYRLAKVVARTEEVIGNSERAIEWLRSKQAALGNRIPFELISTSPGVEAVNDVLGRIEYGIYS